MDDSSNASILTGYQEVPSTRMIPYERNWRAYIVFIVSTACYLPMMFTPSLIAMLVLPVVVIVTGVLMRLEYMSLPVRASISVADRQFEQFGVSDPMVGEYAPIDGDLEQQHRLAPVTETEFTWDALLGLGQSAPVSIKQRMNENGYVISRLPPGFASCFVFGSTVWCWLSLLVHNLYEGQSIRPGAYFPDTIAQECLKGNTSYYSRCYRGWTTQGMLEFETWILFAVTFDIVYAHCWRVRVSSHFHLAWKHTDLLLSQDEGVLFQKPMNNSLATCTIEACVAILFVGWFAFADIPDLQRKSKYCPTFTFVYNIVFTIPGLLAAVFIFTKFLRGNGGPFKMCEYRCSQLTLALVSLMREHDDNGDDGIYGKLVDWWARREYYLNVLFPINYAHATMPVVSAMMAFIATTGFGMQKYITCGSHPGRCLYPTVRFVFAAALLCGSIVLIQLANAVKIFEEQRRHAAILQRIGTFSDDKRVQHVSQGMVALTDKLDGAPTIFGLSVRPALFNIIGSSMATAAVSVLLTTMRQYNVL